MTSSSRHLNQGQNKWDYNIQRYKSHDPFLEPDLFSIIFLACGRPDISKKSLLSTLDCLKLYSGDIEYLFIENNEDNSVYSIFNELNLDRKVIVRSKNYGINHGLNQGWALSRGEFCLIHENDWESKLSINYLQIALDIFRLNKRVGIIQLRSIWDNNEQWGRGKPEYWPWDLSEKVLANKNIHVWKEKTFNDFEYLVSDFPNGFNNNPIIMRKSVYRKCGVYPEAEIGTDPRHGETEYQLRIKNSGILTAHINLDLYYHMGKIQTVPK